MEQILEEQESRCIILTKTFNGSSSVVEGNNLTEDFVDLKIERIKNPPPEGVVLSLPLKGDKAAFCPLRRQG